MRLLNSDPFVFGHGFADMQLVAFRTIFALHHSAGVQRIVQDTAH